MRKTILRAHSSSSVQTTAPKNTLYSKNESILKMAKIGHDAKVIAFAKWSVWVKNWKSQIGGRNDSTSTLELLCAKNRSKKHLIFGKWEHFKNGQNCPRRKRYSLCKMVSLGQKLKMPKRCEKQFYEHNRVVVCKKPLPKTPCIRKMRAFWKWPKLATIQRLYIAFAKWSVWVKN